MKIKFEIEVDQRKLNSAAIAFIEVYKPAVWLQHPDDKMDIKHLKEQNKYFFVRDTTLRYRNNRKRINYWFFHTHKEANEFKRNYKINDSLNDKCIGLALGFPPGAVEGFCELDCRHRTDHMNDELYNTRVGVGYGGITFMSYERCILEDIKWLLENRPFPKQTNDNIRITFYREGVDINLNAVANQPVSIKKLLNEVKGNLNKIYIC
jgi:hypothetical protein